MKRVSFKQVNLERQDTQPKKGQALIKISCLVIVAGLLFEVWLVNRLSTLGEKLSSLKASQASIELENQLLENDIAVSSSLASISKKSTALGFTSMKSIEYLTPASIASVQ